MDDATPMTSNCSTVQDKKLFIEDSGIQMQNRAPPRLSSDTPTRNLDRDGSDCQVGASTRPWRRFQLVIYATI